MSKPKNRPLKNPEEIEIEPSGGTSKESPQPARDPDELDFLAKKRFYEVELLRAQLAKFEDDNKSRKIFSIVLFGVTVVWMAAVFWLVSSAGKGKHKFSDGVLIALITTTTANVFGFFYIVVNYLFNKEKST